MKRLHFGQTDPKNDMIKIKSFVTIIKLKLYFNHKFVEIFDKTVIRIENKSPSIV